MASILEQYEREQQTVGNYPSSRQILPDEPVSFILNLAFFLVIYNSSQCITIFVVYSCVKVHNWRTECN